MEPLVKRVANTQSDAVSHSIELKYEIKPPRVAQRRRLIAMTFLFI
jgi:hypothetical protein